MMQRSRGWSVQLEKVQNYMRQRWSSIKMAGFLFLGAVIFHHQFLKGGPSSGGGRDPYPPHQRYEDPILYDRFPSGFKWGAATAAYQVRIDCEY